jgi:hypothetical protein
MRWKKVYDCTIESLMDKSRRPHTPHPNSHTTEEIEKIKNLVRRNPKIGLTELYTKLRQTMLEVKKNITKKDNVNITNGDKGEMWSPLNMETGNFKGTKI